MKENRSDIKQYGEGRWDFFLKGDNPKDDITGKYLFFSKSKKVLKRVALDEIKNHGFNFAKIDHKPLSSDLKHVLCLYYKDDSRKWELANRYKDAWGRRNKEELDYRFWKSDLETEKGEYSKSFLEKLSKENREAFSADKTEIFSGSVLKINISKSFNRKNKNNKSQKRIISTLNKMGGNVKTPLKHKSH